MQKKTPRVSGFNNDPYAKLANKSFQHGGGRKAPHLKQAHGSHTPHAQSPRALLDPYAQAQQDVNSIYGPAAQSITSALLNATKNQVGQVNARTGWQQAQLAPYAAQNQGIYQQAAGGVGALGNAISGAAAHLGQGLATNIGAKLADIQAPQQAVAQDAASQAAIGQAAGNVLGGLSSADVARLQSQGNAASAYAAGLPQIAGLAGAKDVRNIVQQASLDYASKMADLQAQEFSAKIDAQRYYSDRAYQRSVDAQARKLDAQKFRYQQIQDKLDRKRQARLDALATQAAAQEYGLKVAGVNQRQQQLGISQQNANTSSFRARVSALTADRNWVAKQQSLGISRARLQLAARNEVRLEHKGKSGGFTASQVQKLKSQAYDTAVEDRDGWTDTAGVNHPPISGGKAYAKLVGHGVPPSMAYATIKRVFPNFGNVQVNPKNPQIKVPGLSR